MLSSEHKIIIIAEFKLEGNELYSAAPRIVEAIIEEVNKALDEGSARFKNPDEKLKCRERMHHTEGIEAITKELTKAYGEIYKELIKQAATKHVIDDMGGIYKKHDYQNPHFWPKWKAQNKTQYAWV